MLTTSTHAMAPAQTPAVGLGIPLPPMLDASALGRLQELDPSGANRLLERVFKAFETSVHRLRPQLEAARAAHDLPGIRHVAHTLKSSSASIGALRLSGLCAEVEGLVRLQKGEELGAPLDAMAIELEVVLKALTAYPPAPAA